MFYDKDLMNSKSLGVVWRAAHNFGDEQSDEISVNNICNKLDSWVDSNHEEAHRRLALRTSSAFVDGAARLYKRKMELLFEDVKSLDKEMFSPKRSRNLTGNENETLNTNISENDDTASEKESTPKTTSELLTHSKESNERSYLESDNDQSDTGSIEHQEEDIPIAKKADKEVQTCLEEHPNISDGGSFDQNLPFGFVIVHNNYHSRIPSRIIVSSFSREVSKLISN